MGIFACFVQIVDYDFQYFLKEFWISSKGNLNDLKYAINWDPITRFEIPKQKKTTIWISDISRRFPFTFLYTGLIMVKIVNPFRAENSLLAKFD